MYLGIDLDGEVNPDSFINLDFASSLDRQQVIETQDAEYAKSLKIDKEKVGVRSFYSRKHASTSVAVLKMYGERKVYFHYAHDYVT